MPLAACSRCNKMFNKTESPVCPACQPAEDADFEKVREAVDRDSNLNAEQVADETNVDIAVVQRMIKDGVIENALLGEPVVCGMCGAPAISMSKKLCQDCLDKLNAEMIAATRGIKLEAKKEVRVGEYMNAREEFDKKRRNP